MTQQEGPMTQQEGLITQQEGLITTRKDPWFRREYDDYAVSHLDDTVFAIQGMLSKNPPLSTPINKSNQSTPAICRNNLNR